MSDNQEIEMLLKEYDALRAEIIMRLEAQTQLSTVATILIGGILTAVPLLLTFGPQKQILKFPPSVTVIILLIISTLFTSILWTYMEHDTEMAYIGQYFNESILPKLAVHLHENSKTAKILNWDRFRSIKMALIKSNASNPLVVTISVTLLSSSRIVLILMPILFSLGVSVAVYINNPFNLFSGVGVICLLFFPLTSAYSIAALIQSFYIRRAYKDIVN